MANKSNIAIILSLLAYRQAVAKAAALMATSAG